MATDPIEYLTEHMNHRALSEGGILSGIGALEESFSLFMVQVVIILSICRVLALLGLYLKQPRVIFEIIGK
jgi:cytochrome c oxidase assembly factor CtaG